MVVCAMTVSTASRAPALVGFPAFAVLPISMSALPTRASTVAPGGPSGSRQGDVALPQGSDGHHRDGPGDGRDGVAVLPRGRSGHQLGRQPGLQSLPQIGST